MRFDHHVYIHYDGLGDVLKAIANLERKIMSLKDDLQNALNAIDVKTSNLSARIDSIVAKLQDPSLTPDEKTAVLAHLSAIGDSLDAMAKDPANPVPEPTPLPPA